MSTYNEQEAIDEMKEWSQLGFRALVAVKSDEHYRQYFEVKVWEATT